MLKKEDLFNKKTIIKNATEADQLQKTLFSLGFKWISGSDQPIIFQLDYERVIYFFPPDHVCSFPHIAHGEIQGANLGSNVIQLEFILNGIGPDHKEKP